MSRILNFPLGLAVLSILLPYREWLIGAGIYPLADAHRAAGLFVIGITLLLGLLRLALGNWAKAGTVALLALFPFYLMRDVAIVPAVISILILATALVERRIPYNKILIISNVFGLAMLGSLLPVYRQAQETRTIVPVAGNTLPVLELHRTPSIVHIVLDGYGAPEVLESFYDHDTTAFRSALAARGFVIFRDTRTPFNQTLPTMASVMSGAEVSLMQAESSSFSYRRDLGYTVQSGLVPQTFRMAGYTLAASDSGYGHLDSSDSIRVGQPHSIVTDLEAALLSLPEADDVAVRHIASLKAVLAPDTLDQLPQPFFYYQHLLAPHPPFVINADGSQRSSLDNTVNDGSHFVQNDPDRRLEYSLGYREKARFVEAALLRQLDGLPSGPIVVVIQGDHGPGGHMDNEDVARSCMPERMRTFLAVYSNVAEVQAAFATHAETGASFSLVNIYRVLLSVLSGEPIPLVATRSRFLSWSDPAQAVDVTDQVNLGDCVTTDAVTALSEHF